MTGARRAFLDTPLNPTKFPDSGRFGRILVFEERLMPTITLPDGAKRPFDRPVSGAELAASIGPGLAKAALAIRLDGEVRDLSHVIDHDAKVEIVTRTSP